MDPKVLTFGRILTGYLQPDIDVAFFPVGGSNLLLNNATPPETEGL